MQSFCEKRPALKFAIHTSGTIRQKLVTLGYESKKKVETTVYDQSFNKRTLARVFQKTDFVGIKTPADLEAFRENMLNKAVATATSGFVEIANPLVNFPLNGRQIFMFHSLWEEMVARKLCSNIKKTSKSTSRGRSQIVSNLCLLLEEGVPFRVYRLDVKSFYESFSVAHILSKVGEIAELSPLSKRLMHDLLACHAALGGAGLPRGLSLSAALSDHLMQDFDHQVNGHSEVFFFSRYVDDIIVVTSGREDATIFVRKLEEMLPPELHLNPAKRQVVEAKERVNPTKPSDAAVHLFRFDYLGYSFQISEPVKEKNKSHGEYRRTVVVDLAEKKRIRFKTRISRSFLDFAKTGDWFLLRDRIKFLTKNFSVYNAKAGGKKVAGIFHSYPLASSDVEGMMALDRFLKNSILSKSGRISSRSSSKLTAAKKRELLSNSFADGHSKVSFVYFSGSRLKQIQECWKN